MRDIKIELHKPTFDELKFREDCMSDSNTMSYNKGAKKTLKRVFSFGAPSGTRIHTKKM